MNTVLLLPIVSGLAMSSIFFLPKAGSVAESAIVMKLPESLGEWRFNEVPASPKEVEILAKDTDFSKAVCIAPMPGAYNQFGERLGQRLDLSVVLSGADINNSIHRPERCMPAQGHQIYDSKSASITTEKGRTFSARELTSMQTVTDATGKEVTFHCVSYYFFVGQHEITSDHMQRTFIDMKDRVVRGQDQRWAYVSASMWFSESSENNFPTRQAAETEIRQFLGNLADRNIDWQQISSH